MVLASIYSQRPRSSPILAMGSDPHHQLHIFFVPLMAPGHMIPMVDVAKLFAERGVKATLITTPGNAPLIKGSIDKLPESGHQIRLLVLPFPPSKHRLLDRYENLASIASWDQQLEFLMAIDVLRHPLEQAMREHLPDCIVSDAFFPWTADVAREFGGIPRLVFHGTSLFSQCVGDSLQRHGLPQSLPHDARSFVVPGIPHRIEVLKTQLPDLRQVRPDFTGRMGEIAASESRSYGVVVNSFYGLEPEYVEHYRKGMGRKAWLVGPVSLSNKDTVDQALRGGDKASIDSDTSSSSLISWLDSKKPNSVLYVCFGSLCRFGATQLREMALGLEASGTPFIWVVRSGGGTSELSLDGFERRVVEGKKGLVITGWAPQILILNHKAIGGFLMHCGWNSTLEAITAGVPMVTWPLYAEQFYNERLIVDVLRVGVAVGVEQYPMREEDRVLVKAEEIEEAVAQLMNGGEEADAMRRRVKELSVIAKWAVEEGGTSYADLDSMIHALIDVRTVGMPDKSLTT